VLTMPLIVLASSRIAVMNEEEGTEVCGCSQVDFGVGEDAFCGALVEAVHSGVACVGA
jgi:hypothetical protein